ncbi:MAG: hypothetical protein ABIH23_31260 [bacterium]
MVIVYLTYDRFDKQSGRFSYGSSLNALLIAPVVSSMVAGVGDGLCKQRSRGGGFVCRDSWTPVGGRR